MICGWAPGCGKVGQNTGVFLVRIHGHLKASAPTFAIPAAGFKDVQSAGRYSRQQASDSCLCIPGLRPTPAKDWLPPAFTDRPAIKVLWIRLIQRSLNGTPFGYLRRLLSYRALRPVNGNRIVSLSTPRLLLRRQNPRRPRLRQRRTARHRLESPAPFSASRPGAAHAVPPAFSLPTVVPRLAPWGGNPGQVSLARSSPAGGIGCQYYTDNRPPLRAPQNV